MTANILVLNAGSSSIKFSLYAVTRNAVGAKSHCEGAVEMSGKASLTSLSLSVS
jgi:acetate kinase